MFRTSRATKWKRDMSIAISFLRAVNNIESASMQRGFIAVLRHRCLLYRFSYSDLVRDTCQFIVIYQMHLFASPPSPPSQVSLHRRSRITRKHSAWAEWVSETGEATRIARVDRDRRTRDNGCCGILKGPSGGEGIRQRDDHDRRTERSGVERGALERGLEEPSGGGRGGGQLLICGGSGVGEYGPAVHTRANCTGDGALCARNAYVRRRGSPWGLSRASLSFSRSVESGGDDGARVIGRAIDGRDGRSWRDCVGSWERKYGAHPSPAVRRCGGSS